MELGPLVKRAARAGDLRGCHLGLGRPPNKGSGNDSRPCGLKLSALGGVERAEHPDEETSPPLSGVLPGGSNVLRQERCLITVFSKNNGLIPVVHHSSQHGRSASAYSTSVLTPMLPFASMGRRRLRVGL